MDFVTLAEAKLHCRADDSTDEDPWFETMISAVSEAVSLWLKDPWRPFLLSDDLDTNGDPIPEVDSNGDPIVRKTVKAAVLVEIAQQYRYREGTLDVLVPESWGHGYVLGIGATSLLSALRKTTVA